MKAKSLVLAASICAWSLTVDASQFSNTVFFGDSLTDAGTIPAAIPGSLPAGTGKFTTNPGPVWAEVLGGYFGVTVKPAAAGGTDYAWGGARVNSSPGFDPTNPLTAAATPISTQVGTYLATAGGKADSRALYSVWGGANDIFFIASGLAAQSTLYTSASDLAAQVGRLKAAGARYVIVPNIPDIGKTPFGLSQTAPNRAALTALSSGYNQLVALDLNVAKLGVIPVDIFTLFNAMAANPSAFGFVNATSPACNVAVLPGNSSLTCTAAALVAPNAQNTYVFADGVHPTTAAHAIMARYVEALVVAPQEISLLAESAVKMRQGLVATIHDQAMLSSWSQPNGSNFWVSGGTGDLKFDQNSDFQGNSGKPNSLTVGADTPVSPHLRLGAAATLNQYHPDYTVTGGGYKQDETVVSIYGNYANGPLQFSTVFGAGSTNYETHRNIALGTYMLSVPGSTNGSNLSLSLQASYELGDGGLHHGPMMGLDAQNAVVKAFSESNPLSAGLSYQEQQRHSSVANIGYRASYEIGNAMLFGRIALDRELANADRDIGVTYLSQPGPAVSFAAASLDRSYETLAFGAVARFTPKITGSAVVNALQGQSNVRNYNVQLTLNFGF